MVISMENQAKFMELMQEVKDIVSAQNREITKEEIEKYFQDMDLTKQHYDAVYQYLFENGIKIQGFAGKVYEPPEEEDMAQETQIHEKAEKKKKAESTLSQKDEKAVERYLQNLRGITRIKKAEEEDMLAELAASRTEKIKETYITGKQHAVVKIAKEYCGKGIPAEELIQEGNMGLLHAVAELMNGDARQPYAAFVEEKIRNAVVSVIDDRICEKDWENTMLAKTNLLHSAAEYLAEENGRVPTKAELAEYTRIPLKEIEEMFRLSKDVAEVADKDGL